MKHLSELTGLYSLSKTLRFELQPVGRTLEYIEQRDLIHDDETLNDCYKEVKKIIDDFHKRFIQICLTDLRLPMQSVEKNVGLADYEALANRSNRTQKDDKDFDGVKTNLREQVVAAFTRHPMYKDLFSKKLIINHLPEFVADDPDKLAMVQRFEKFTKYFEGFFENRANMYSDKAQTTAIAYRIIHENLPIFLDNIKVFDRVAASEVAEQFADLEVAFGNELQGVTLTDFFGLGNFTHTLTQDRIDLYNRIIGARVEKDGSLVQGLNARINLHNQQNKDSRLPFLRPLYKMILSDRLAPDWLPEEFKSDDEMTGAVVEMCNLLEPILRGEDEGSLRNLLLNLSAYDPSRIYITTGPALTDLSQHLFGQYDRYTSAIKAEIASHTKFTRKEISNAEARAERITKLYKACKSHSIAALDALSGGEASLVTYFQSLGAFDRDNNKCKDLFELLDEAREAAADILNGSCDDIGQSADATARVKALLDAYKALQHFIKPLLGSGDEAEKDADFYARLHAVWDALDIVTPLYNKVRNRLTRKPYNQEKIRLHFGIKTKLMKGWVDSKTESSDNGTQYKGYLFRKRNQIGEYDYFLGISDDAKLFRRTDAVPVVPGQYERLDYYQLRSQTLFGSSYQGNYEQDCKALLDTFEKAVDDLNEVADCKPVPEEKVPTYLKRLKRDHYEAYSRLMAVETVKQTHDIMKTHFLSTLAKQNRVEAALQLSKRDDLSVDELFDEMMLMPSKSFSYFPVDDTAIREANERTEKTLYLFKITNKDLSYAETFVKGLRKSRGRENLHTMYFKCMMEMLQGTYDIGSGSVYYRQKTKGLAETTTVHKANVKIANKNKLNKKQESSFTYDIVKNRRYTCDKFQFHLSMIFNYRQSDNNTHVNAHVQDIIRAGGIEHVIGIDRGERHLLYLTLIDLEGHLIKQMTLNEIVNEYQGKEHTVNYHDLLADREGDRTEARRNWQRIDNIKELKEGYLSQVVHVISRMMVEYNAIVVLEDLNAGFMRGRQKIERQVYEKFERALIDKLNYYVDKRQTDPTQPGGLLHALQLANKFESFSKLGKQSGCLFYVRPWCTSKIDPVTGFTNLFRSADLRYSSVEATQRFFKKFDAIRYNAGCGWFEFTFDYDRFDTTVKGGRTQWTVCTHGERIRTFRNAEKNHNWDNEKVVLTDEFKIAFAAAGIDIHGDLQASILALNAREHLETLLHLFRLTLQLRNSVTGTKKDYILSPVADADGQFYDSRTCDKSLPEDADANGAYNIARKGLWTLRKIQAQPAADNKLPAISNAEWLQFVQEYPIED